MFSTRELLPCVVLAASAAVSQVAVAQSVAVDFGGDFVPGNINSSLDDGPQLQVGTGDFNGDMVTDARTFIPIDHDGLFLNSTQLSGAGITGGATSSLRAGMQIVNYGTSTPSNVGLFRANDRGASDSIQMTTAAQAAGATGQGQAFLPHVNKDAFLNGLNGATSLSFTDQADGFSVDWAFGQSVVAPGIRRVRGLVQDGSDWYISDRVSGSKNSDFSFNPFSESWYQIDLTNDMFYGEVGGGDLTPNSANILSLGVLGSTFTDIQAIGAHTLASNYDGSSNNAGNIQLEGLSVTLDGVFPPPPTPQSGFALAEWNMDSIISGATTTDQFGNVFTSDAVLDASMTPNPGLIGGDITDPLLLGDATPADFGTTGVRFPVSTRPVQTTGGMGFGGGEALDFDGVDDEALGITAWLGDTSESLFIPGLEGVYVEVDFKEDANTGNGVQNIVGARTVWELRIDNDGNLEWVTWLENGGSDTIEFALDEEGDWRNVQAFHNADGSKGLIVDGTLVAQSFTEESLREDRRSILVGSEENEDRFFGGLIDNVFVGSGILESLLGDYNGNGVVDAADYTIWADNFNSTIDLAADGNGDGVINAADYTVWADNFGSTAAVAFTIPEPHSLTLLGLGGLAMLGRYRRSA